MEQILGGLLRRVGDKNKHVQAAACGALATLVGECREDIAPWLAPVAQTLGQAVSSYGRKNLRCALDAAATLADSAGDALRDPAVASALLAPLVKPATTPAAPEPRRSGYWNFINPSKPTKMRREFAQRRQPKRAQARR